MENGGELQQEEAPMYKLILVSSIAAGIQFGWALQLSLLTPYVQMLGLTHAASSFIWLCGPISGLLVQPIAGYFSDRSTCKFGRRRPFIVAGTVLVSVAVVLIGFAADIGYATGDDITKSTKPRAVLVFVIGFWILDVANNMLQGPCRAFLADLSAGNPKKMTIAMAYFSLFMAVGNILGYAAGSWSQLHTFLPFPTKTDACDVFCANLKSCFLVHVFLLMHIVPAALMVVKEPEYSVVETSGKGGGLSVFCELFGALKNLSKPMWILMLVTCLNWIAWFPFLLYDTDWMGREVYGGDVKEPIYDVGVRAGAIGLMINAVVLAFTSILLLKFGKGAYAAKAWWLGVNLVLGVGLACTVWVSNYATQMRQRGPDGSVLPPVASVKASAFAIFGVLGIPLAVTFSIPFALASIYCSKAGAGQGLSLGVLNLSIVVPQIIVSLSSGPLDKAFGGGNLPAFVVGAIAAILSGILAFILLPAPDNDESEKSQPLPAGEMH